MKPSQIKMNGIYRGKTGESRKVLRLLSGGRVAYRSKIPGTHRCNLSDFADWALEITYGKTALVQSPRSELRGNVAGGSR